MRRFISILFLFCVLTTLRPGAAFAAEAGWEVISTDNGIEVAKKTMPDSALFAFRGEGVVDVHLSVLAGLLLDDVKGPEWVDLMEESEPLQRDSEYSKIIYQAYGLPWPIQDRDYVMRKQGTFDQDTKVFTLQFQSIETPLKGEDDCCVRATAHRTFWRLKALPDGKTNAEVEVFTDPKGLLPSWLINLIQKDWPRNTIEGLTARASKGDIQGHKDAVDW